LVKQRVKRLRLNRVEMGELRLKKRSVSLVYRDVRTKSHQLR
jgi:hypothetical protein